MTDNNDINRERAMARIAHCLDGRGEDLTEAEAEVLEEIRTDEAWLGSMMSVDVPADVLQRSYARMHEALALQKSSVPLWRRAWPALAVSTAAAAAIVIAAVVMFMAEAPRVTVGPVAAAEQALEQFLAEETSDFDVQFSAVDEEVTLAWADLAIDNEFSTAYEASTVDEDLREYYFQNESADLLDGADL